MKNLIYCLPVLAVLASVPETALAQGRILRLDEVIDLGLANSKALQISGAKAAAAQSKTAQTHDATFPTVSYNGSYTRLSENIDPFSITLPNGENKVLNPVIPNQYLNRLSVTEPVFTGLRAINTIRATEFLEQAARFDFEKDRKDVQLNLTAAAINLYKLQSALAVVDKNLATAQNRLTDTYHLRDQGMALDNDVLRSELAVAQLQTARIETANAIAAAQYNLAILLGLPTDQGIQIDSASLFAGPESAESLDYFLGNSAGRADVRAADQRALAAAKQLRITQGTYYPLISVGANLYTNRPNQRVFPPQDRFLSTWDAGLNVSWNLSNFYTSRHTVQESKLNLLQAQLQRSQLDDAAKSDIANNFYNWQTARQKTLLAEKTVAQALENQRITQLRNSQQIASLSDLLDADALLAQAQINEAGARADARMAYFKLLKSAGKL
ncbi:MAG TPA: TolC family protein [Saprospiraceae bacterium]|nr:TolC family protein [Saprospiraceae bacterium]